MTHTIFDEAAARLFADPMDEMVNTCIYPVYADSYERTKQLIENQQLLTGDVKQKDCGVYLFGEAIKLNKPNALRAFLDAGMLYANKEAVLQGVFVAIDCQNAPAARLMRDNAVSRANVAFVTFQSVKQSQNRARVNE